MASLFQPFLDLLPYRLEQALGNPTLRSVRVRRVRRSKRTAVPASKTRRRLFIDLAVISKHDAGTGIQRVVRELALSLIDEAPTNWDIHFVAATRRRKYHLISWPSPLEPVDFTPITSTPGDIFLGLDYSLDAVRRHRKQLAAFRRNGGTLWFLVHDLLPLEKPEWFSTNTVIRYKAWLGILAGLADGFLCNSEQTEEDLKRNLDKEFGLKDGYSTVVLPMGHKISDPPLIPSDTRSQPARFDARAPFFLMVGTLEPRKGHGDMLAAFSRLWADGAPERLVLVGRTGWQVDGLHQAILNHPEHGRKLFWFDDVDDAELFDLYENCSGGIIASYGEGFGLPLVEFLGHGKPVFARDLAVFRPHAKMGVNYFPVDANDTLLATYLQSWMNDVNANRIMVTRPDTSWKTSAQVLISAV